MKTQKMTIDSLALMIQKEFKSLKDEFNMSRSGLNLLKSEFNSFKGEFGSLKTEFNEFKNESLTNEDEIIEKLDKLIDENEIRNYQEEKQKKFFGIVIKHLETGRTTPEQLEEISKLDIL